ncbi:MAG: polysaccharide deacetylase family protein, partial [Alphaproteobacteria bacterium]|nr:polysaccharide deacetylase family protein [Alphaproteobacteria bacterium]
AAAKGEAGQTALARLRSRIVRDAQISRIPALRAKRGKGRRRPERPALPPIGAATRLPVLMYHEVVAVDAEASRFATTIEAFEAQLRWLAEAGYQSIGAAEWANAVRAGRPIPEKSVLITFDDAYVDFADLAWPALRRNGFSAALFAPALYVGKSPAWRGAPKGQRLLDYTTLRGLSDDGCEIGSHAMSHRHLTSLGPEDMLEEAFESKKILEDMIGQEVNVVAYPFGDSDTAVRSAFRIAGFRGGFCAWGGASTLDDDPMNIARIEVRGDMSLDACDRSLRGRDEPLGLVKPPEAPASGHKFRKRPAFGDCSAVEQDDLVGRLDRREPVRDDDHGAPATERGERMLEGPLGLCVQRVGRLVEQEKFRIADDGARERDPLALTAGQAPPAVAETRVPALRQAFDEAIRMSDPGGVAQRRFRGVGASVKDVFAHGGVEQEDVLAHD